jgi:hypothetical protein
MMDVVSPPKCEAGLIGQDQQVPDLVPLSMIPALALPPSAIDNRDVLHFPRFSILQFKRDAVTLLLAKLLVKCRKNLLAANYIFALNFIQLLVIVYFNDSCTQFVCEEIQEFIEAHASTVFRNKFLNASVAISQNDLHRAFRRPQTEVGGKSVYC